MKTLYGPGLASALLTLLPLSFAAIRWLMLQTITGSDVLIGVLLIAAVILGLIRMPIMSWKQEPGSWPRGLRRRPRTSPTS